MLLYRKHQTRGLINFSSSATAQGFTLIELLLVLALLGFITVLVMNVFISNIRLFRAGVDRVELDEEARAILHHLTRDIESLFIPPASSMIPLRGENRVIHTASAQAIQADSLRFSTIVSSLHEREGFGKLRWIEYALDFSPEKETGILKRKLSPFSETEQSVQRELSLSTHVQELNFRYRDQQHWYEEWSQAQVPAGVEISLTLHKPGRERPTTRSYRTFVHIPMR